MKKYSCVLLAVLFLPLTQDYFRYVLNGTFYIPHIAVSFATIAIIFAYCDNENHAFLVVSSVLALLAGMGGIRQLTILYGPLIATILLIILIRKFKPTRWEIKFAKIGTLSFLASVAGYLINTFILSRNHLFNDYNSIDITGLNLQKFWHNLHSLVNCFGYTFDKPMAESKIGFVLSSIFWIFTFLSVAYLLKSHRASNGQKVMAVLTLITLAVQLAMIFVFAATDMYYHSRYNIPFLPAILITDMMALKSIDFNPHRKSIVALTAVFILTIFSLKNYDTLDHTRELREISDYLVSNGYKTGYTTFWNANLMTALSNGEIEVYDWGDYEDMSTVTSINEIYTWLQPTSHLEIKPSGKIFVLLNWNQYLSSNWKQQLDLHGSILTTDNFICYGYDSYEEATEDIPVFFNGGNEYIINDSEYTDLIFNTYPGVYCVELIGENASYADICLSSSEIKIEDIEKDSDMRKFLLSVDESMQKFYIRLKNNSGKRIQIKCKITCEG